MKLETITMDKEAAMRAFLEYRNAVRAKHSDEDAEIMRGYQQLAKGRQLIRLSETIAAGGLMDIATTRSRYDHKTNRSWREPATNKLPRLAVARASAQWCHLKIDVQNITFSEQRNYPSNTKTSIRRVPRVAGVADAATYDDYRAMVPPVPPRFRPSASLDNFHILWEAEWQRQAPIDPALLKHIGGDLYAVLAVWDLTELERSVLMRRFQ